MESDVIELRGVWKIFGDRAQEALAAIRSENLSKAEILERFDCVVGVVDASFNVHRGEIFCVMGLSGSGKSTLVRHINRLLEPTAGEILINGQDVMAKNEEELRLLRAEKIGMVFQNIALLPHRTVRDNVALPLEVQGMSKMERWDVAEKCLEIVELNGWEDKFAHELSGGMQQRVGLARAIAADPDILLMDEPFSALDPLIRRQLQDQFMDLSQRLKKTTVFITHDLDEAIRIGDRIAIMKDGVIVQIGTPEKIVTEPADDYVADFVAGISRLKLVFAHSIMEPIEAYKANGHNSLDGAPRVTEDTDLDHLIDVAVETEGPMVVIDGDKKEIGVITKADLLHGIQGGKG
ncbi:MAG: betaine/proline/choline family ABC transporter ATP-binding protein [Kiloniellales bacterium]|nr:betaine/proline/choline family ABC transporter ATP-binding protein [Kiloniellales bacterium]